MSHRGIAGTGNCPGVPLKYFILHLPGAWKRRIHRFFRELKEVIPDVI